MNRKVDKVDDSFLTISAADWPYRGSFGLNPQAKLGLVSPPNRGGSVLREITDDLAPGRLMMRNLRRHGSPRVFSAQRFEPPSNLPPMTSPSPRGTARQPVHPPPSGADIFPGACSAVLAGTDRAEKGCLPARRDFSGCAPRVVQGHLVSGRRFGGNDDT